jgi:hypothetical protein
VPFSSKISTIKLAVKVSAVQVFSMCMPPYFCSFCLCVFPGYHGGRGKHRADSWVERDKGRRGWLLCPARLFRRRHRSNSQPPSENFVMQWTMQDLRHCGFSMCKWFLGFFYQCWWPDCSSTHCRDKMTSIDSYLVCSHLRIGRVSKVPFTSVWMWKGNHTLLLFDNVIKQEV